MSWYRESNGTIVVDDPNLIKTHLNIGFWIREEDGKLILLDESLLYLCGKERKRRIYRGRRSSSEVTHSKAYGSVISHLIKNEVADGCCRDKKRCRFWNSVYNVCSLQGNIKAMKKEKTPCTTNKFNKRK